MAVSLEVPKMIPWIYDRVKSNLGKHAHWEKALHSLKFAKSPI